MTDILKPDLIWIEGRCYRTNDSNTKLTSFQEHDLYESEETNDNMFNEGDEDDFEITELGNFRFSTSIHVSQYYLGAIIGKKGAMKMRIERDTKTELKIPKHGQNGDIMIYGSSAGNLKAARRRINIIVMSSRMKQKPTHFISIPVNSVEVMENFKKFKELVLQDCGNSRGLDASLFIEPQKLHLTVGVMCLMDNEERLHASKLLTEANEKIVIPLLREHMPFKIRVKDLSYMNDEPTNMTVLYGCVQEEWATTGVLQRLADSLVQFFYNAGYMNNKDYGRDNVKLHVTLINSSYRTSTNMDESAGRQRKVPFDGSQILEKFANYDFGVAELNSLHLSQIHTTASDGYYQSTCVVPITK